MKAVQAATTMSFKAFLEEVPPGVEAQIHDLWTVSFRVPGSSGKREMAATAIDIFCDSEKCNGVREFRVSQHGTVPPGDAVHDTFVGFLCGNCRRRTKTYALCMRLYDEKGQAAVWKYGESPQFGPPVPRPVLALFGNDKQVFLKGRQCENQGMGIGAFGYYRRVVENHKDAILDKMLSVCEAISAPQAFVDQLQAAKRDVSFTTALEKIEPLPPQLLMRGGHNPLKLLHRALSEGLHADSDEECLRKAQAIRTLLAHIVDRVKNLLGSHEEVHDAVQFLLGNEGKAGGPEKA